MQKAVENFVVFGCSSNIPRRMSDEFCNMMMFTIKLYLIFIMQVSDENVITVAKFERTKGLTSFNLLPTNRSRKNCEARNSFIVY